MIAQVINFNSSGFLITGFTWRFEDDLYKCNVTEANNDELSDWDSEDELVLNNLVDTTEVIWTNDESYVTKQNAFKEETATTLKIWNGRLYLFLKDFGNTIF